MGVPTGITGRLYPGVSSSFITIVLVVVFTDLTIVNGGIPGPTTVIPAVISDGVVTEANVKVVFPVPEDAAEVALLKGVKSKGKIVK